MTIINNLYKPQWGHQFQGRSSHHHSDAWICTRCVGHRKTETGYHFHGGHPVMAWNKILNFMTAYHHQQIYKKLHLIDNNHGLKMSYLTQSTMRIFSIFNFCCNCRAAMATELKKQKPMACWCSA